MKVKDDKIIEWPEIFLEMHVRFKLLKREISNYINLKIINEI